MSTRERLAHLLLWGLVLGLPLAVFTAQSRARAQVTEVHARMPEQGGFLPDNLTTRVGEPLRLRLISDDVLHGFAIGQSDQPEVELYPGKPVDVTLTFDQPGTYIFYCTRWCGPNHWRMRGTITVEGTDQTADPGNPVEPLYFTLELDLDAPHPAEVVPDVRPSAARGAALGVRLPDAIGDPDYIRAHSPAGVWQTLRTAPETAELDDQAVWDLVALLWQRQTTPTRLAEGQTLYNRNCAACHGELGRGDGVFAAAEDSTGQDGFGHEIIPPPDFRDPATMLGASPALLQGKILRGGMGTGMPSWGLIFSEEQTWAMVDYLWTFVMDLQLTQ